MEKDTLLIKRIDDFLQTTGMTPTRFGEKSLKDPNLVFQVREGRWLRGPTRKKVLDFMEKSSEPDPAMQALGT
ncbi:MAG: hypothetical protein AAFP81_00975 [Pseudomonadota bacterium]